MAQGVGSWVAKCRRLSVAMVILSFRALIVITIAVIINISHLLTELIVCLIKSLKKSEKRAKAIGPAPIKNARPVKTKACTIAEVGQSNIFVKSAMTLQPRIASIQFPVPLVAAFPSRLGNLLTKSLGGGVTSRSMRIATIVLVRVARVIL